MNWILEDTEKVAGVAAAVGGLLAALSAVVALVAGRKTRRGDGVDIPQFAWSLLFIWSIIISTCVILISTDSGVVQSWIKEVPRPVFTYFNKPTILYVEEPSEIKLIIIETKLDDENVELRFATLPGRVSSNSVKLGNYVSAILSAPNMEIKAPNEHIQMVDYNAEITIFLVCHAAHNWQNSG